MRETYEKIFALLLLLCYMWYMIVCYFSFYSFWVKALNIFYF
uniref:Uncharacterized protein n=1 Tax=Lutzomyia longipalpis TaxID=7200 RepID=A0A1B0CQ49_LUTLO